MAFLIVGCLLVVLKLLELGPFGDWSWWGVLAPFALAAIWWTIADLTGDTRRRAIERDRKRVEDRRERHLKAMGLDLPGRKKRP